ncbi:hypothetical protein [Anaerolinea sp.]|uniref:hypothetical protein n=1 Tax=Anaerolinea sp. TaxID=1872519 RepID=UPI002ACED0D7|nr:hypothetical protein [Anaerolinea sp.]
MSEAYLFGWAEASSPRQAWEGALKQAFARPAWLQVAHWLGEVHPEELEAIPHYLWGAGLPQMHLALHAVLRSLREGEVDLCLFLEVDARGTAAFLLGSPQAVGRWNLPPHARLTPLGGSLPDALEAAARQRAQAWLGEDVSAGEVLSASPAEGLLRGILRGLAQVRQSSQPVILLSCDRWSGLATLIEAL